MTKEDLAHQLNGLEYPCRIPMPWVHAAQKAGLVIVFGASDDLMEFRGAINEELGVYADTEVLITPEGLWEPDACEAHCRYFQEAERAAKIEGQTITALWDPGDGYSWRYMTDIPHATFEVLEEGETYCRGLVFALQDVAHA